MITLPSYKPARRHTCEICNKIFDCHLCSTRISHPVHVELRRSTDYVYVCILCAIEHEYNFVTTLSAYSKVREKDIVKKVNLVRIYNYYDGRLLTKQRVFGRVDNINCWSANPPLVVQKLS